jgi:hypothetical protein
VSFGSASVIMADEDYDEDEAKSRRISRIGDEIRRIEVGASLARQGKVAADPNHDRRRIQLQIELEDENMRLTRKEAERKLRYEDDY